MMIKKSAIYILFLIFSFNTLYANYERILHYDSDITILEDGSIDVVENIIFLVQNDDIKLGIVREIPTSFKVRGKTYKTPVGIYYIKLDDKDENYWIEQNLNTIEILTGKEEAASSEDYISKGVHKYTIAYKSSGHIRGFDKFDELYFNVTGNDWIFDIDKVSATIHIPKKANIIQNAAYIGKYGSTKSIEAIYQDNNSIKFETSKKLYKNEGLSIAVGFTKDIVKTNYKSSFFDTQINKIIEYFYPYVGYNSAILIIFICISIIFYFIVWLKYGKEDRHKIIMPRFYPPKDISIALASVVVQKYRNIKAVFVATLVDLAIKGFLEIKDDRIYKKNSGNFDKLQKDEEKILEGMFTSSSFVYTKKHTLGLEFAFNTIQSNIKNFVKEYISSKRVIAIFGLLAQLVAIYFIHSELFFWLLTVIVLVGFYSPFFYVIFNILKDGKFALFLFTFLFTSLHFSVFMIAISYYYIGNSESFIVCLFFLITWSIINIFSIFKMQKLKKNMLDTRDELLGLEMFLKATKSEYQNITIEMFEKNLPYAIIFGLEKQWIKKFKLLNNDEYTPAWYVGENHNFNYAVLNSFSNNINSAKKSLSSSTRSSSSGGGFNSSGSSGSGSSGGGSGGGGGRGR